VGQLPRVIDQKISVCEVNHRITGTLGPGARRVRRKYRSNTGQTRENPERWSVNSLSLVNETVNRLSALALIETQVATLTVCTPEGRLLRENDPFAGNTADRFFLGRTAEGNVWRCRHDLPDALVAELEAIVRSEPVCPDPIGLASAEPVTAPQVRAVLTRHAAPRGEHRGPAYFLPIGAAAPPWAVEVTDANLEVLTAAFPRLAQALPAIRPCAVSLEDGGAVAVCFSARSSAAAAEAGVTTREQYRGKGHGSAAVACWAGAVHRSGRLALYSTSWNNVASQALARRLGAVLYGEDFTIA
jgi:hypothetical protein